MLYSRGLKPRGKKQSYSDKYCYCNFMKFKEHCYAVDVDNTVGIFVMSSMILFKTILGYIYRIFMCKNFPVRDVWIYSHMCA